MTTLKQIIQNRRNMKSSDGVLLKMVAEAALSDMREEMEKLLGEYKNTLNSLIRSAEQNTERDIIDKAEKHINNKIPHLKGEDGKTPTKEELINIITPLIPQIKDGKTPTKEELINIITPLIPQIKDGKTPTKEELINIIKPLLMQKVKTPEEICDIVIKKIEEKKISIENIEGLQNMLNILNKNIVAMKGRKVAGGGGGMSTPQHQQFTGNGSTTTFTLNYRVAAGSKAIFGFYQGQQISLTTHYTVSGTTVTTTFTPETGTVVEFIYWRT